MRKMLALTLFYLVRFSLWFRYRVTIKGLENLDPKILDKTGGVLFLPNHPTVFVDPTLVTLALWKKYPIRPMIVEYMYYTPVIHTVMKFMNALPVPNFSTSSNSLKKKRADQVFETAIEGLKQGDNFLIYPAGKTKHQAREIIGASGVHRVIQAAPEANVVLVKTTGLWGSSFSWALTGGQSPAMFPAIWKGIKIAFKNLIFFTPRRHVTIEFVPAGPDFPYNGSRLELNTYLEKWYNRPDGLTETKEKEPGESLNLVSYSMWRKELPSVKIAPKEKAFDNAKIPQEIQQKVKEKLAEISHRPIAEITPETSLGSDLGLDSLDNAEILTFLDDTYDISGVPVADLTTVGKVMAIAANQVSFKPQVEENQEDLTKWNQSIGTRSRLTIAPGETVHETFLNNCARMGNAIACGDARSGILTYAQAKLRIVLLAEHIRKLPGEYIGVLLPSSAAAYLTILACQLAGKVPLMINWTVGPRHLEAVASLSKVQVVLSSWAFLDRLENANLSGVEDLIVTLEDMRSKFTLGDKLKAFYRSKLSTKSILKAFDVEFLGKQSKAVLLFTSGTESLPKGVPLTHENILSNQRAAAEMVELYSDDVLLSILPPFHAFGFTVSGLFPLLLGLRAAFYPDPTNGKGLAKSAQHWRATVVCGAPTFIKGMFKNARNEELKTLRICVTGAEKTPVELFQMIKQLGHCVLIEGYGITECGPILTINKEFDSEKGVGKALSGVEIEIVNLEDHQAKLPRNQTGLIIAKGPNIFSGYLNKGITSPFLFINDQKWYSTGDLGYLDNESNLIISGRLKRFVKIGGEMVSLAAIEDSLQNTVGQKAKHLLEEGPTLAMSSKEEAGEKTKLFLFTRFEVTAEEVNRALKEEGFSNLVKIAKVVQLSEIPLMGSGKINYRALEAQLPALNGNNLELSKAN